MRRSVWRGKSARAHPPGRGRAAPAGEAHEMRLEMRRTPRGCGLPLVLWDDSVPGDGRGSCGRTLGRGIRPALNPLLRSARPTPLGETSPAPGRRSRSHGRMRTSPGAMDISGIWTARSRSWLRPWVACRHLRYLRAISALMRESRSRSPHAECQEAIYGRSQLRERAVQVL